MAKILLVEDDNNLREIYEARLQAEGYTIVSAHDGEEALVVAKAEKPDLIISDVMMPKISGFEMLDILRNTDSLKDVKVIMLTALGQSDDQQRAAKLGSDRYLVKSQVTLEDIVNVANELLQPNATPVDATMPSSPPTTTPPPSQPAAPTASAPPPVPEPPAPAPAPSPAPVSAPPATPDPVAPAPEPPVAEPVVVPAPPEPPVSATSAPAPAVTSIPVSEPPAAEPPAAADKPEPPKDVTPGLAESESQEESTVKSQIESFMENQKDDTEKPKPANQPLEGGETTASPDDAPSQSAYKMKDEADNAGVGYTPQPLGKRVIEPLPSSNTKPDINELLEKEKAKEIMETAASTQAVPVMPAADTAPTPGEPVIKPTVASGGVDPSSIAL